MSEYYFDFLEKTINILVVDDEDFQLALYKELLQDHRLLQIYTASTGREAEKILRGKTPVHMCFFDLGITDIDNDEYYLLKRYGQWLPFIIVSGASDMERAFEARAFGASKLIEKPIDVEEDKFWNIFTDSFLNQVIVPKSSLDKTHLLYECCRIVREEKPLNVSDWGRKAGIHASYLRRLWNDCYNASPKKVLFLYQLFNKALRYHNGLFLSSFDKAEFTFDIGDRKEYRQKKTYYLQNKEELENLLLMDKPW